MPFEPACAATYPMLVAGLTSHYRVVSPGQSWVTAERDCESDGGHLAIIDDDAENVWLTSIATQAVTASGSSNQLIWIGLGDQRTEGEFRWVNGATLGQTYWAANEPSSLNGNEDCVEIRKTGEWNDDHCAAKLSYVCECDGALSAGEWCDTDSPTTCGDCSTACSANQTCSVQKCK